MNPLLQGLPPNVGRTYSGWQGGIPGVWNQASQSTALSWVILSLKKAKRNVLNISESMDRCRNLVKYAFKNGLNSSAGKRSSQVIDVPIYVQAILKVENQSWNR